MNHKNLMRTWLPLIVYCLLILIQSSLPMPLLTIKHTDKVVHFVVYAILGVLLFRALSSLPGQKKGVMTLLAALLLSSLIAAGDEFIQIFVPTRNIDRVDFLFDMLGSFSGIFIYATVALLRRRKNRDTDT